jgi:peptidoglycan/LPS O-acetylase OafA/YrhL
MSTKKRNFGLDLLRAISILLVLIAHKIQLPVELGLLGVQVFFILSGYLIGQILLADFEGANSFSTVLHFWKRRWFRTLPMYYLVLTLLIFFGNNPYGWKVIVYYFFLQANFIGIDLFPVSWSLVVEEWFYIFLPLSTFLFFPKGIRPKFYLKFVFFFIGFFYIIRFAWTYLEKGLYQFETLLLGVLLATLKTHFTSFYEKLAKPKIALSGLLAVFFLIYIMGNMSDHELYSAFYRVTWYLLLSISIACILPFFELSWAVNDLSEKNHIIHTIVTWTSVLSYSLYLLHPFFYGINFNSVNAVTCTFQFVLLFGFSFITYFFFERPVTNLREKNYWSKYYSKVKDVFGNRK